MFVTRQPQCLPEQVYKSVLTVIAKAMWHANVAWLQSSVGLTTLLFAGCNHRKQARQRSTHIYKTIGSHAKKAQADKVNEKTSYYFITPTTLTATFHHIHSHKQKHLETL